MRKSRRLLKTADTINDTIFIGDRYSIMRTDSLTILFLIRFITHATTLEAVFGPSGG